MKTCSRCQTSKPLARYSPAPRNRDGLSSWCRDCANAANRRWRASNPGYLAAANDARRVIHEPRACIGCGIRFTPPRKDSRHCCSACRQLCRANSTPLLSETAAHHIATYHRRERWLLDAAPNLRQDAPKLRGQNP
jgi:hypothetical protein